MNDYKIEEYGKLLHDKKTKFKYNSKKIEAYFVTDDKYILTRLVYKQYARDMLDNLSDWDNVSDFLNDIKNNASGSFVLWVQQEQNKKKSKRQKEKELYKEFNIKSTSSDALSDESYIIRDMIETLSNVDKENE